MIKCPLTGSGNVQVIYQQKSVPLFQNKTYAGKNEALNAVCTDVTLAQSLDNGFVFSTYFDDALVNYDMNYQNEQSHSAFFREHLHQVQQIMQQNHLLDGKVVEIGCGKAYFLEMLAEEGANIIGFDPTYEGNSDRVVKDYFSDKYSDVGADFIILRHTLEHIRNPHQFLKVIAAANKNKGNIFIEVPTFDWIVRHNATEDIFYEHCNYFTLDTLQMLFHQSLGGHFFNDQYIYVIADLAAVKDEIEKREVKPVVVRFDEKIEEYKKAISQVDNIAIWGAGAKGSTFLNLVDKDATRIKCVVDINPKKQHRYIGGTGHYVVPPGELEKMGIQHVVVMNTNYIDEIRAVTTPLDIQLITL